jgi:hypothetical protein
VAKALKTVAVIAGAVALVATGVGAFAGGAIVGTAVGAAGPVAVTLGSVAGTIATYAGIAAGVANIGASLAYSHKPPPARGSVTRILIDPDAPQPYAMGEGYLAGVLRHDTAWGATLKKVPNPYRLMVVTYSGGGPIESITPYVDQGAVPGWYSTYLYTDTQLGETPESAALTAQWASPPGWDTTSKLSGYAAIAWSLKFDKDGERFAAGLPQLGAYGQWVKVYDPRLDSTQAGGSGTHRSDDETTWEWSENPALHAGTYALGRHQNGKRVLGVGLPAEAIDWAAVSAWANVCDANDWTIFGVVYEPMPDTRWPNLKDIAAAGGGVPIFVGGQISFVYPAPRVALDTLTEADLIEGAPHQVTAMTSRKGRINQIFPKYRSPDHNWELVAAGAPVTGSTYVTEDGETRSAEWPFNLVKNGDQAVQLAAYRIAEGRELQPIELVCNLRLAEYGPGDCLHLDIPTLALDHDAVIVAREFDPASLTTRFTLISETADKHDWALGRTVTPPPSASLAQTAQERDELAAAAQKPYGWQLAIIRAARVKNPRTTGNVTRALLTATDAGASATISAARHDWDYPDSDTDVTRELGTITGLSFATLYYVYFDDTTLTAGTVTYAATTDYQTAQNSSTNPARHFLGGIVTPADGAADTSSDGVIGPGPGAGPSIYTGLAYLNGTVATAVTNFNSDNDGNALTPDAPTSVSISSVLMKDSTAAVTGSWSFTPSSTPSHKNSIDGYLAGWMGQPIGTGGYTYDPADLNSMRLVPVTRPDVTTITSQLPADREWTLVVFSFRKVRADVNSSTTIFSAVAQSSSTTPHNPATSPLFQGKIGTLIDADDVEAYANAANAGLNSDGTVKASKVDTAAIIANALNAADWEVQGGTISIGAGAGGAWQQTYITLDVETDGDDLIVQLMLHYEIDVLDPNFNDVADFSVRLLAQRMIGGSPVQDFWSDDGANDPFKPNETWIGANQTGAYSHGQRYALFQHTFEGMAAGEYDVGFRAEGGTADGVGMVPYRLIRAETRKAFD